MKISVFYNHILTASAQTGLTVEQVLSRVRGFGIEAVELDLDEVKPSRAELKKQLQDADIAVSSMYAFFDFGNVPKAEPGFCFIDTAEELGAAKVLVIPGFIDETKEPREREIALNRMVGVLRDMCDYAEQKNMIVTMEDFDDAHAPFSSSDELLWFMEQVPKLRCTFDTGNFIYSGENELEAFEKLKDKIVHVHCKDRSLDAQNGGTPKVSTNGTKLFPSPVGYGCISMEEIINRLFASGYNDTGH